MLSNRTTAKVDVEVLVEGALPRSLSIPPGDCRPVAATSAVSVRLGGNVSAPAHVLEPNCVYAINPAAGDAAPRLSKMPLGESPGGAWEPSDPPYAEFAGRTIDVKLLVDDDERRPQTAWEPELRRRIATASDVLAAYGGVRLRVVAVGQWDSSDDEPDFQRAMAEFEREASPAPAQVAIGFTSQYEVVRGRHHMGGTRGALHSHILLKERAPNVLDTERLELLVHELGHFMGATHSAESNSVMRPVVGQGQLRHAGEAIRFDPANALLMSLVGAGNSAPRNSVARRAHPRTCGNGWHEIYAALDPKLPDDPATGNYLQLLGAAAVQPLIEDTRHVLAEIVRVAKIERQRREVDGPPGTTSNDAATGRPAAGVLRAPSGAGRQAGAPRERAAGAGAGAGRRHRRSEGMLRRLPLARRVIAQLEGETARAERLAALGEPTMRGRADLAKHFFVSAHLVALVGSEAARSAGMAKEMLDSHGGSGFSFRDMAADRAGIVFAHAVMGGTLSLDDVAQRFTVDAFLPSVDDLREAMQADELFRSFGGAGDQRFAAELARIESRIMQLPAYSVDELPPAAPK